MTRSLSHLAVGLAGGLLALGLHTYIAPAQPAAPATSGEQAGAPVKFVNLPGPGGTSMTVPDLVDAAERTVNAVVHVTTEAMVQQRDPFAEFFWGYRSAPSVPLRGAGSGVIISEDGYIVTNNHVVEGADRIQVHLNDKRQFEAKVIGRDPSTDLALIKVDAKDLPVIAYANSDDVKVGEWVLAVGNPMNLTSTVTAGIVSAKARNINLLQYDQTRDVFPIESFIQTDAAVNPGNSGGALVNVSGELVGINSAIASTTGAYSGYSFAIPANIVRKVTGDLMEFGTVQRAYIGVSIGDVDQDLARQLAMDRIRGVYVKDITSDGAAEAAGIKAGDVILKVGSIDVNNVPQLQEQVGKFRPGDKVAVTVLRDGRENVMDLVLRGREGNTKVAARDDATKSGLVLGAQLVKATPDELRALKLQNGVKVKTLNGGKLRSSGIREGFIITRIDQQPMREPEDILNALGSRKGGVLIEGVYPNGMKAYYGLGI
jgi:Do/DeqQ family serine protease